MTGKSCAPCPAASSSPAICRPGRPAAQLYVRTLPLARRLRSGYNLARMPFAIVLAPEAVEDLKRLRAGDRASLKEALARHLRHQPGKTSRSRIKRLRGLSRPQYRLRVGDIRVFYDINDGTVEVLAIVPKSETAIWLARFGKP
jgi:mRNA interferase RelE/StbE